MKKILLTLFAITSLNCSGYEVIEDTSDLSIKTPSLIDRKTAKLRLDNGAEVYIVSDPDADQSAVAVAIGVGSWSDPEKYPGTAHFVEHMLFLGTSGYPDEDGFMHRVADNGGSVNAYTASDRTVYMFSCTNSALAKLSDELSYFFIDPLMNESSVGRELHAVNQEYEKNRESDGWRGWMIFKELGNPSHPNAKFSTGNADTLGQIPVSEVRSWYEKNYSSERLHIAIYSNESIDELTKMAVSQYGRIPNRSVDPLPKTTKLTSEQQEGHITYITPIRDVRSLSLSWELPIDLATSDTTQSMNLIGYALSQKGENSLYALLKKEGLAEGVSAGAGDLGKDTSLFELDVDLSLEGVSKVDFVIEKCMQAISSLQESSVPSYLASERIAMATYAYEFQGREDAFSFASNAADNLTKEPLASYPRNSFIPSQYDHEKVSKGLNLLKAETCIITLMAPPSLTMIETDRVEKWNKGEYKVEQLSSERIATLDRLDPTPLFGAPAPNPFIPTNIEAPKSDSSEPIKEASLLVSSNKVEIYYAEDTFYHVPEVSMEFHFKSPLMDGTADQAALLDLYSLSLQERLAPFLSSAKRAGIDASFSRSKYNFSLSIEGYAEKTPELIDVIVYGLKTVRPSAEEFNRVKVALQSSYENSMKSMPFQTVREIASSALYINSNRAVALYSALKDISYDEFLYYASTLFDTAYIEGVMSGALSEQEARNAWNKIEAGMTFEPFAKDLHPKQKVLLLDNGSPFKIESTTPMQGNAALLTIQQGAFTYPKKASQLILGTAINSSFFETLRTKQQTGYITKGWYTEIEGQLMQNFAVQSTTHEPNELIARFELFLEDFSKEFTENLPKERFETIKAQLITQLAAPATNLDDRVNELFVLAFTYHDFSRTDKLIEAVTNLSYEQLQSDTLTFLSRENRARLAILLEGAHASSSNLRYKEVSAELLRKEGSYVTAQLEQ